MKKFTLILLWLLIIPGLLMAQWKSSDAGTGTKLKQLCVLDNQNAIIVGIDTTIIKTIDGGNVWEKMNFTLPNDIDYDFNGVDFADDQTGFIVTPSKTPYNGIMLKTIDGGLNWNEVSLSSFSDGSGNDVTDPVAGVSVQFRWVKMNSDIGYVAVQWTEAATTTKHGYIFKTNDKGLNWTISSSDIGSAIVFSIEVLEETVFVGGNNNLFMKSIDGGANWTDLDPTIAYITDVELVDANKLFVTAMDGTYFSENGGVNVSKLNSNAAWGALYFAFAADDLIFTGNSTTKTVRSIDGGANWEVASNGQTGTFWSVGVFNDTIYGLCNSGIINKLHPSELKNPVIEFSNSFKGSEAQFANESKNCGSYEWIFNADSSSIIENPIYRFADYDTHIIKLIGENAVISDTIEHEVSVLEPTVDFTFITEDGNKVDFMSTSTNYAEFEWDFGELTGSVGELTPLHVYSELGTFNVTLTAHNYIDTISVEKEVTVDSVGAFWSKNQLEIDQILQKMHVFNDDVAIAIGNSTTIIKSIDGGETWVEKTFPTENDGHITNDIIFFDDNTGLITASAFGSVNGFMLTTIDQGENWTQIPLNAFSDGSGDETIDPVAGIKVYFYAMEQIDENNAFVALRWQDASSLYHGFIYKTTDKGATWSKTSNDIYQENSYTSTITDMCFALSGTIGFVAGNKFLLKTEDSGVTWTNISNEAFGYITEMLVLNDDTILAATGNGVLKTTDCFVNTELKTSDYSFDIISLGDDKFMAGKDASTLGVTENLGETWVNMGNGLAASFFELTIFNGKIFAFSSKGLTSISYIDNYQIPVVDFEYSIDDLTVTFTDKSENIIASNWSFGDDEVSTELSPEYTYADYGKYTVVLNGNNRCKKASVSKEIELVEATTGVDLIEASNIKVYPNPVVNDKLYIDLGDTYDGEISVEIYNTEGRQLMSKSYNSSSLIELDININKGLYFVKVNNNDGINHTMKLVVQ